MTPKDWENIEINLLFKYEQELYKACQDNDLNTVKFLYKYNKELFEQHVVDWCIAFARDFNNDDITQFFRTTFVKRKRTN